MPVRSSSRGRISGTCTPPTTAACTCATCRTSSPASPPPPELAAFYAQLTCQNRVCFLTGQRAFDSLLERARELKAINQIIGEMHEEGVADGDAQMQQAREQLLPRFLAQFHSAIRETFTTVHYPTKARLAKVDFTMEFRENRYNGEERVREALAGKMKFTTDVESEGFRARIEERLFTQQSMLWTEIKRRTATAPVWQWHRPDALERMKAQCLHTDMWREEGSYVNKGPFPKPATTVQVRELSRDDDTGVAKLRLSPVNGDTLYAETGADATPASMKLEGRDFKTADLRVSFLAVDSSGAHETGAAVAYTNRITLKSREYLDGEQRMAELRAAPAAPIRYTTDGSDPALSGGAYDGPFAVPPGTRLILAVAAKDGITSDQHRLEIAEKPAEQPIARDKPAVWQPEREFEFNTTRTAYGFIARLTQHAAGASGLRLAVQRAGDSGEWVELNLSQGLQLDGERIKQAVEHLRQLLGDGEVAINAKRLHYATGQRFLDHIADLCMQYRRDDVKQ